MSVFFQQSSTVRLVGAPTASELAQHSTAHAASSRRESYAKTEPISEQETDCPHIQPKPTKTPGLASRQTRLRAQCNFPGGGVCGRGLPEAALLCACFSYSSSSPIAGTRLVYYTPAPMKIIPQLGHPAINTASSSPQTIRFFFPFSSANKALLLSSPAFRT